MPIVPATATTTATMTTVGNHGLVAAWAEATGCVVGSPEVVGVDVVVEAVGCDWASCMTRSAASAPAQPGVGVAVTVVGSWGASGMSNSVVGMALAIATSPATLGWRLSPEL